MFCVLLANIQCFVVPELSTVISYFKVISLHTVNFKILLLLIFQFLYIFQCPSKRCVSIDILSLLESCSLLYF